MTKKLIELLEKGNEEISILSSKEWQKKADLREMYLIQEVAKRCEGTERSFYKKLYNQRKKEYDGKYEE